ncbi:ABC transporter permease [Rhodobacteraceae bacterium N5(2021)]|uniref:ABC transporter permease n=1 Tax=Gymnodinialimonas phycosphaerae TaxID=2841589 RepID=A0A975TTV8_9RHOB|nr:ABC transporter permease [Gymnodinialimonas phycosphaerae]MBY4894971.1 ABC transporter permease [Gymnodinialimonas phycosphaerae]
MIIDPVTLIVALITISTPVLLAALGELVVEKSGVLNLGVEGMMIMGAVCGFIVAHNTGSPTLAFIAGMAGGAALSLIFAFLTQFLMSNQVATGLALTLFGLGLAALLGVGYEGQPIPDVAKPLPEALREMPVIGPILLGHDLVTYLAVAAVFAIAYVLKHTRTGLIIRAVGESHDAAHALGYKVIRIRCAAIVFGGAMAGLGGAFLSIVYVENWVQGMTAGAGWIALALVVFAAWKSGRVLFGAWLFGGIAALQLRLQAAEVPVPVALLDASPYLVTIIVLVVMSSDRAKAAINAPASLGKTFHASG